MSYEWDLGDGNSSASTMVDHTYASAGTYTVKLTVTSPDGQSHVYTTSVTASVAPATDNSLIYLTIGIIIVVVAIGAVGAVLMNRKK